MLIQTLVLATLLGAPFEDVQHRFTVDLPDGWKFAPLPGDVNGAAFQKLDQGMAAHASIQMLEVGVSARLDEAAKSAAAAAAREPGYELVTEEPCTLAGMPAVRRRWVHLIKGDKRFAKMVEDRLALAGGTLYMFHVETLAEAFGSYEAEFEHLFTTFKPRVASAPAPDELIDSPIIGRWALAADGRTVLELRADGTFDLDGVGGTFRLEGSRLLTTPRGGLEEAFSWEVQGDVLLLRSPTFAEAMRYERIPVPGRQGGTNAGSKRTKAQGSKARQR